MALPIVLPAIAEGAAALSAALGLTAIATKNDQNFGNINLNRIRTATGLNIAPLVISTGVLFNKANSPVKVNVPSADNALVLRPEYRTEVAPVTYDDFIMESRLGDAWGVLRGKKKVAEQDTSGSSGSQENPKPENPENNDKKPFWKSGLGKAVKWTGGIAGTALAAPHIWNLGSWYFMDYVPSRIRSRNQESTKSNEPEYIELTEEELKKLERLTK